ncbi:MAG: TonB family protein [candidate division Zixibacteria bacterium]|nr:TonB family protein [candidate division Zixibacteria bacterium]
MITILRAEHFPLKKESDLKFFYQPFVRKATIFALILHLVAAAGYFTVNAIIERSRATGTRIVTYADLGPPPALTEAPTMPDIPVNAPSQPVIGIPEPVDDTEVSAEMTIATQTEMSQSVAPVVQDIEEANIVIEAPREEKIVIEEDALPAPDTFVAFETPPAPVRPIKPVYPEMARNAGIEGTVILFALIDKEGKVRDVQVRKGIGGGLDEAAVEAVKAIPWTPAIQNNRPVSVWMSVPVRFRLR